MSKLDPTGKLVQLRYKRSFTAPTELLSLTRSQPVLYSLSQTLGTLQRQGLCPICAVGRSNARESSTALCSCLAARQAHGRSPVTCPRRSRWLHT